MSTEVVLKHGLIVTELAASVVGFLNWNKIRNSYWKWFPVYLAVVVLVEVNGTLLMALLDDPANKKWEGTRLNSAMFRYFGIPIQFLFFFWLFSRYFYKQKEYKWPLIGAAIYILSWIIEMLFFEKVHTWFMSFSYTIGNIMFLVMIILFFVRFVNSEEILNYRSSMMFWVSLGLMSFYLLTFPFYALRNTLWYNYTGVFYIYQSVSLALDYLMYLFFIIAFIWGRPK